MTSASIILVAFAALFLSSSDLITSGQSSRTNDQNTYSALFHWRFSRFLVSIPALTAQENRNMHVAQHESGEIDELLAFVGTFDIGEDAGGIKPQAHSPDDLSESTWLDDLEKLFMETNPLKPVAAAVLKMTPGSLSAQSIMSKDPKSLTLTAAAPVATAAKKASSRPRVSRKEELEYLRRKVKEMESKLHHLKETERALPAHDATESSGNEQGTPPPGPSITLWKTMAQRQKNQRDMVEVENATLREQLKTQVRMAKSLKRILCKRTRDNDQTSKETPKRLKPILQGDHSTAALFNEMLSCLDELYMETDKHFDHCPTATLSTPAIRLRDVKYSDISGMFLEFQDSKLWPFDLETVSRATWRFLTEAGLKFNNYVEEHVEIRNNTMLRKFGVEFKHGESVAVLFGRQVFRRYVEPDRTVLVRHSIIDEIQLPGARTGGLTFRESGWIVLRSATEVPGTGPMTLTQAYSTISPDIDLNLHWEIGTLTDFVLQSREEVEVGNDMIIENLLLQEASK